ncbi:ATP-binding protein [Sphaerisporangium sp. NPDC049002]|uniref:ATP-binding protein n=1 Tax=unclassified Sphaerisporangium TaxID=2630420 RepID=UPI0033CF2394
MPSHRQNWVKGNLLGVIDLPGSPESAQQAREYVRRKLDDNHPALDDVTLLVSEIVTNAVVHSNSRDGGKITLALADCFDRIHVDVVDEGGASVPRVGGDIFGEGGRGLMIVELISDRWAVYEDEAGRTVWFEVRYGQQASEDAAHYPPVQPSGRGESALRRTARHAARTVGESLQIEQGYV